MWQPIETAPKTGYICVAWKNGKWRFSEAWWDELYEEWTCTSSDRYLKPTWAPLPDPA